MGFFVRPTSNEFYQLSQASLEGQLFSQNVISVSNFHLTHFFQNEVYTYLFRKFGRNLSIPVPFLVFWHGKIFLISSSDS